MTPLAKILFGTAGIGVVIAATLALRSHPAPAVERAKLSPAQRVEIQQPKAEQLRPEPPTVARPEPSDDDVEDGNGS